MTPERWQQIERLFHAALERPAAERSAFLDQECGGDAELRSEVESLLATRAETVPFLEGAAIDVAARHAAQHAARLAPGQHIGPFTVSARLGAGGMGEVWRARDSALGRDVAIKVLTALHSSDPERLRRFEQEARAAGQINHPNILTVHAVGHHDGSPYLVTELLEGETLHQRLGAGALPARKAVEIAIQIARGLAAAHERGIVHRDLKPANLFMTTDGRVKILDFGLAKLTQADAATGDHVHSMSGAILGTAGYMAPEQIRGHVVDHRADLFSLGIVLYEMLAGRRAFTAASVVETMNQILVSEPSPIDDVDPGLSRIVQHCLEKDPAARFQSARDLAFHLESATSGSDVGTTSGGRMTSRRSAGFSPPRWLPWALTGAAAIIAIAASMRGGERASTASSAPLRRFSMSMAATPLHTVEWPPLAISPDARRIAYVARDGGRAQIVVRDLDGLTARAIPGTENACAPFFSPDGEDLGFFTNDSVMRVALAGGPPVRLASARAVSRGAVWTDEGRIYFSPSQSSGVFRIPANGGTAEPLTLDDALKSREGHVWPDVSPDGTVLMYTARRGDSFNEARIVVRSLRTGVQRTIIDNGTYARFAPNGRIVFARGATLHAVEFDPARLELRGLPRPILSDVQMNPLFGGADYAIARDGTLVYAPGDARPLARRLLWVTASGVEAGAFPEERPFLMPAVSPDGTAVAVTIEGVHQDLWRFDIGRAVLTRLTSSTSEDFGPVWSPDGTRMAYTSIRQGEPPAMFVKPADRADGETKIVASSFADSWSSVADEVIVTTRLTTGGRDRTDLFAIAPSGGTPRPLGASRYDRYASTLSASDHIAFVSLETGSPEVFVGVHDTSDARQASVGGGTSPVWSRDGRQLFYRNGDAVMSVAVGPGPRPSTSTPKLLFRGQFEEPARPDWSRNYDVAPDGRFLMIRQTYTPLPRELVVVLGWRGQPLISTK
jgi:Tol biopolymer transport system component/tRNA A-37 threonylcarbamoyl transferase component Bud32